MSRFYQFCCLLILSVVGSMTIFAQTTIFNVPSTDVTAEKAIYFEADFVAHFDKLKKGGFQTYGYKTVYGLGKKIEVGTNFFFTRSSLPSLKEFQANAKWKVFESEKYGFAVSTGTQIFVPLRNKTGLKTVSMFYSNASKVISQVKGMRLTGGYYTIVGAKSDFGSKNGAIVGVEQPVIRKMSFLADWYSGKNRFGYSSAGLSFAVTKKQILYAGYNFGNVGRANNSFSFYYGVNY